MADVRSARVHTFVLAGGNGSRLAPLTDRQCKPALPFCADYRVIDFVLGNLCRSGLPSADVLVQFRPHGLMQHLRQVWQDPADEAEARFAEAVGPYGAPFRGTADAVTRNLARVSPDVDLVLVFGADHVYRMDVAQMIGFHLATGAQVTVSTLPVPLAAASAFGIVETDDSGRARRFREKPADAQPRPGWPGEALASMGNYVFDARLLRCELARAAAAGETDFGHDLLPRLVERCRVMAYDFRSQLLGGTAPTREPHYWRDIGTLGAYHEAHMDTLADTFGGRPRFEPDDPAWPLRPSRAAAGDAPPRLHGSDIVASRIGAAACVERASVHSSVIGRGAEIGRGALVERSVVFDGVRIGEGARIRRAIVAEDNEIPARERIGYDPEVDRIRFTVTREGIVVVPPGTFTASEHRAPADATAGT